MNRLRLDSMGLPYSKNLESWRIFEDQDTLFSEGSFLQENTSNSSESIPENYCISEAVDDNKPDPKKEVELAPSMSVGSSLSALSTITPSPHSKTLPIYGSIFQHFTDHSETQSNSSESPTTNMPTLIDNAHLPLTQNEKHDSTSLNSSVERITFPHRRNSIKMRGNSLQCQSSQHTKTYPNNTINNDQPNLSATSFDKLTPPEQYSAPSGLSQHPQFLTQVKEASKKYAPVRTSKSINYGSLTMMENINYPQLPQLNSTTKSKLTVDDIDLYLQTCQAHFDSDKLEVFRSTIQQHPTTINKDKSTDLLSQQNLSTQDEPIHQSPDSINITEHLVDHTNLTEYSTSHDNSLESPPQLNNTQQQPHLKSNNTQNEDTPIKNEKSVSLSKLEGNLDEDVSSISLSRANFILNHTHFNYLNEKYLFDGKILGRGTYGSVFRALHRESGNSRAIKIIQKSNLKDMKRLRQEVSIMKSVDHPNITKLYESYEDSNNIYLIMELCQGGELFDLILKKKSFSERTAAHIMKQIFSAVNYMHSIGISHRDLKPENFLLLNHTEISIKIIDFGLSRRFTPGIHFTTQAGTPYYVDPQVLRGYYDHSCDNWSSGIIMYLLLCGHPPFYGDTDMEILEKIKIGYFTFDPVEWKHLSQESKDLITKLLKYNSEERYTAEEALRHPWIMKFSSNPYISESLPSSLLENLKNFLAINKLKRAALTVIALRSSEKDITYLKEIFYSLDKDNNGKLSIQEIIDCLERLGYQNDRVDFTEIMQQIDSDQSGNIDYTEFLATFMDRKLYLNETACRDAFRVFDLVIHYLLLSFLFYFFLLLIYFTLISNTQPNL